MYKPAAFLISSAALTSIFSFFFGSYYIERKRAYHLWLKYVAYGKEITCPDENIDVCAELESRDRMFNHARGLLGILLITIGLDYLIFQIYSMHYIFPASSNFTPTAFTDYIWFNTIIGCIVMINCLELLYIRIAFHRIKRFPYFKIRPRVSGRDRLSKVWMVIGCSELKAPEYNQQRIPRHFYDNRDYYSEDGGGQL